MQGPRKVVIGTCLYRMWHEYPGVDARLDRLAGFVEEMAARAQEGYQTGLDLAVLPELAVTGEADHIAHAVPLEGKLVEVLGAAARRCRSYVIVGTTLADDAARGIYSNAAVLLDREGAVAGVYRKVHVVAGEDKLEGGLTPGTHFPVFECDFGKLGIQICYDIEFGDGWATLGRKGAEIVAWCSQSSQMIQPRWRAKEHGYHIVSATWKNNASVFDPIGDIIAQTCEEPASVVVTQIDLSYAVLPWQSALRSGAAFAERYGSAAGFRYLESEDRGLFWSNDPQLPIMQMVRELGLETVEEETVRSRQLQDKIRGGPPALD